MCVYYILLINVINTFEYDSVFLVERVALDNSGKFQHVAHL